MNGLVLDDDWWALGEALACRASTTAGIELPSATHRHLTEMVAELLTVVTAWPTPRPPASPLAYLRWRRGRMARHVPWLYELPRPTRRMLVGTDRLPSLLDFAVSEPDVSPSLRRNWLAGLAALIEATEDRVG